MSSAALDDLLRAMQSQTDAQLWSSFRKAMSNKTGTCRPKLTSCEKKDMAQWATRINRREVFSRAYEPSVGEEEEVALLLSKELEECDFLKYCKDSVENSKSIVLKRSPVLIEPKFVHAMRGAGRVGSIEDLTCMVEHKECPERELILLTNYFIVVKTFWDEQNEHIVGKRMESCVPLQDVSAVINADICSASTRRLKPCSETVSAQEDDEGKSFFDTNEFTFRILTKQNESFTFICSSPTQRAAWMNAFQHAVLGEYTRMHYLSSANDGERKLGWQHVLIRKDIFAAAVCGDEHMLMRVSVSRSTIFFDNICSLLYLVLTWLSV